MIKEHIKKLISEIDIVAFFEIINKNINLGYQYDATTNSYVKKTAKKNSYSMERFVFFEEKNNQYYFHFDTYRTGTLYDLILQFDLPKIKKLSKYKVAILLLEKQLKETKNKLKQKSNYTYFTENLNDLKKQNKFISNFFNIQQQSLIKTINDFKLNDKSLFYTYKTLNSFYKGNHSYSLLNHLDLMENQFLIINNNLDLNTVFIFFDLIQIQKLINTNKTVNFNKIVLLNLLKNNRLTFLNQTKNIAFKNYFLIADKNLKNQYFNLQLILNNQSLFYKISKDNTHIILEVLNKNIPNKENFKLNLSKMIKKFKAYNQKITKTKATYNLKKEMNSFSLNYIPTEKSYVFRIPYEIETIELFIIYFLKLKLTTKNINILKLN